MRLRERPRLPPRSKLDTIKRCMILFPCVFQRIWQLHFVRNALLMALHRRRSSSRRSSSSCSSNGVAVLLQYRTAKSPLLSQILRLYSCHLDQKEAGHPLECPASFFVYLQDLNLRHEAPNAKHLAETVRGTVSQRVPYISVLDYAFLPVEQHVFSGVAVLIAVLGHARYKKAGQF